MNTKMILAIVFIAGIVSVYSVIADDSNCSASVVIELVDEGGVSVTNAYVVNLCTNGPFHSLCDPVGLVEGNGKIRFDHPKSPWFLVSPASDPIVITNFPLSLNCQTNRIILKKTPNQATQSIGSEASPQSGR